MHKRMLGSSNNPNRMACQLRRRSLCVKPLSWYIEAETVIHLTSPSLSIGSWAARQTPATTPWIVTSPRATGIVWLSSTTAPWRHQNVTSLTLSSRTRFIALRLFWIRQYRFQLRRFISTASKKKNDESSYIWLIYSWASPFPSSNCIRFSVKENLNHFRMFWFSFSFDFFCCERHIV